MDKASRVRVRGPLASHACEFRELLAGLEYTESSAATHLVLMAQLSRWLDVRKLGTTELTSEWVEEFLSTNRALGHRVPRSSRGSELAPNMAPGFFKPSSFTAARYDDAISWLEVAGAGAPIGKFYHAALTDGLIQVFDIWDSPELGVDPVSPVHNIIKVRSSRPSHRSAFIQNLRRGPYQLGMAAAPKHRLANACNELALAI